MKHNCLTNHFFRIRNFCSLLLKEAKYLGYNLSHSGTKIIYKNATYAKKNVLSCLTTQLILLCPQPATKKYRFRMRIISVYFKCLPTKRNALCRDEKRGGGILGCRNI